MTQFGYVYICGIGWNKSEKGGLSWCQLCHHWWWQRLLLYHYCTDSDEKVDIITTLGFQCYNIFSTKYSQHISYMWLTHKSKIWGMQSFMIFKSNLYSTSAIAVFYAISCSSRPIFAGHRFYTWCAWYRRWESQPYTTLYEYSVGILSIWIKMVSSKKRLSRLQYPLWCWCPHGLGEMR